jgi:hypothetical protein
MDMNASDPMWSGPCEAGTDFGYAMAVQDHGAADMFGRTYGNGQDFDEGQWTAQQQSMPATSSAGGGWPSSRHTSEPSKASANAARHGASSWLGAEKDMTRERVEVQKRQYGEQLFILVRSLEPNLELAQRITGMLLELPRGELLLNLSSREELSARVEEARQVLRQDGIID